MKQGFAQVYLKRVISREMDVKEIDPARVGAISRTHDGCLPLKKVVAYRPCAAIRRGVLLQVRQLLHR